MIKPKKCKYCKDTFTPKAFNQKNCFKDECIKLFYQEVKPKIKKNNEVKRKKERAELKESLKSISKIISEIKPIFQKYIRLRDKNLSCISCGTFTANEFHGGHFKKAEIYSGVIFDERNCHKQCKKCNVFLGGNEGDYRVNLVKRFSEEYLQKLEEYANETRNYKYTREELQQIKEKFKQKINEII